MLFLVPRICKAMLYTTGGKKPGRVLVVPVLEFKQQQQQPTSVLY